MRPSLGLSWRDVDCSGHWKALYAGIRLSPASPRELWVVWHTANDAVLAEGKRVLIDQPDRLDGVIAIHDSTIPT